MRKFFVWAVTCLLALCFSGCGIAFTAEREIADSEIYSKSDISSAMDTVILRFAIDFEGCILTDLYYSDDFADAAKEWAEQYGADEAIVISSDFYVYGNSSGSLQPDEKYSNWKWILVRSEGGRWKLKTWGYA